MLKMIDEIVEHMDKKGYSQLEKIAYVYDYFKEHFIYDPNYQNEIHANNADLDKVFSRDRMVCEGFSNLLSAILRRAGVLCFTYGTDDHQKNIVRVVDEKYGVDNIAILDLTWDLNEKNGTNRNTFDNFLVSLSNDLYAVSAEVINIPTSFFLSDETYNKYISESNPVYATEPLGYGIRMLQLMGLSHDVNKKFATEKELRDFYKDALLNSGLTEMVPAEKIADAVTAVRNQEGKYGYYGIAEAVKDREEIFDETQYRGNSILGLPTIKLFSGKEVIVPAYKSKSMSQFVKTPAQNEKLSYPRKQLAGETKETYDEYLHAFYYDRFIKNSELFGNDESSKVLTKEEIAEAVEEALESVEAPKTADEEKAPVKVKTLTETEIAPVVTDALDSVVVEEAKKPLTAEEMNDSIAEALDKIILEQEKEAKPVTAEEIAPAITEALDSVVVTPIVTDETKKPVTAEEIAPAITDALDSVVVTPIVTEETKKPVVEEPVTEETEPEISEEEEKLPITVRVPQEIIPVEPQKVPVKDTTEEPVKPATEEIKKPVVEEPVKPATEETKKPVVEETEYKPMTAEEIAAARVNIDYDKYEDLYSRSKDEFLPGTDVLKPRDQYEGESDEDYQEYLRAYMDHYFPVEQPEEYIPGTDILKPRNRGLYETEEEYEAYLKMYYDHYFNKETPVEEPTEEKVDGELVEVVTLYVNEEDGLYYVRSYVASRYELHSARFAARIGVDGLNGALCYRISEDDVKKLLDGRNNSLSPYEVEIEYFDRVYDRTDEEYNSFDKPKTLTR